MSERTDDERAIFWEERAKESQAASDYYQAQLVDAHALIGRLLHQMSERWDTANLTKYFPTDNMHGFRGVGHAAGCKEATPHEHVNG